MGLLDTLRLPKRNGSAGKGAPPRAVAPPTTRAPTVHAGASNFSGWKMAVAKPKLDDIDMFFPVTLNGAIREKIDETVLRTRSDFAFTKGDMQRHLSNYRGAEHKLAPLAELEKGLLGLELEFGDAADRQKRWATCRRGAQAALFAVPEPTPKRKK